MRAFGRCGIIGGRARGEFDLVWQIVHLLIRRDGELGELEPGGLVGASGVIDSGGDGEFDGLADRLAEINRRGGAALLVAHDFEIGAFEKVGDHGFGETRAVRTIEPACAENGGLVVFFDRVLLALELRFSVNANRVGGISFGVGGLGESVENKVGGDVDEFCAGFFGGKGEQSGGNSVEAHGGHGIAFGFIDGGVSGAVNNVGVGADVAASDFFEMLGVGDVDVVRPGGIDAPVAGEEGGEQVGAEHALAAEEEDFWLDRLKCGGLAHKFEFIWKELAFARLAFRCRLRAK